MNAYEWAIAKAGVQSPGEVYCPTRDIADGRLSRVFQLAEQKGLDASYGALLAAISGELVANAFDHNLGSWRDVPGCWFEYSAGSGEIKIIVADRGQGFLHTLRHIQSDIRDDAQALEIAFTKVVSGRAPERRGRGLKFVLKSLNESFPGSRLTAVTGSARLEVQTPVLPDQVTKHIRESQDTVRGAYIELHVKVG